MRVSREDLEHYIDRLAAQMDADGVTLAVREGDDWRVVTTEEAAARLKRLSSIVDYRAATMANMDEVERLINPKPSDNE